MLNILNQIANTTSRKEKEAILEAHKDNQFLQKLALYTYNPFWNYYTVQIPDEIEVKDTSYGDKELFELLDKLSSGIRGYKSQELIAEFLSNADFDYTDILGLVLTRDLGIGVGVATFNKIFDDIIPIHAIMKAQSITSQELADLEFPVIVENKLDGCRCGAQLDIETGKVKFLTSNGNLIDIPTLENHIRQNYIQNLAILQEQDWFNKDLKTIDFDGELVSDSRVSTSSLITKFVRGTNADGDDKKLNFHIWDILPGGSVIGDFKSSTSKGKKLQIVKIKQEDRYNLISNFKFAGNLIKAENNICNSPDDILDFYNEMIARENGEGVIIKKLDGFYERGAKHRSSNWLKLKKRNEADLVIVDIEVSPTKDSIIKAYERENKEAPKLMLKSLIAESYDGAIRVNVGTGISDEQRIEWLDKNKILGKIIEVQYFDMIQDSVTQLYSLYLPALSRIRDDKTTANTTNEIAEITGFEL